MIDSSAVTKLKYVSAPAGVNEEKHEKAIEKFHCEMK